VSLAVETGTILDCSSGTAFTLAGNGAGYLLIPELASGGIGSVGYQSHPFVLGDPNGTVTATAPSAEMGAPTPRHGSLAERLDRTLREAD
jgi:hypothetical protein